MIKPFCLVFGLGLLTFCCFNSVFAQTNAKAEKELRKIQEEWAAARLKRDVPYLEKLYSKEFGSRI